MINAPRGTQDIYGLEAKKWQVIEQVILEVARKFGLSEMRTPEFEHTEVFARENDSSDVVNKEMYTFMDNGNRSMTLKPEGTAGLIRAYISNKLYNNPEPLQKYFYISPVFRYERPQKGRLRIHHQFGVELLGVSSPLVDVEAILIGLEFLRQFDVNDVTIYLNTLGDEQSRENYREALKAHFKPHLDDLCHDCHRRYEQNPLRILDCKIDHDHESIQTAPIMSDYLTQEAKEYFEQVKQLLTDNGVHYVIDERLVRGLDYYTHTVFEVKPNNLDAAQNTLFGGGHYDHLVSQLGGPDVPSVGFGMGIERFLLTLEQEGIDIVEEEPTEVYGIGLGVKAQSAMMKMINEIRQQGYSAQMDMSNRSLKAQFKSADRHQAQVILILGEDELEKGTISLKNTITQEQKVINQSELLDVLNIELLGEQFASLLEELEDVSNDENTH